MRKLFLFLTGLFVVAYAYGKAPIKYGKVEKADLEMVRYEPDTSASAVVLCKYGYFRASDLTYNEIIRIKILKKEGLNLGSFVFMGRRSYPTVRGVTTNIENGEIVKTKLVGKNTIKQKVTNSLYKVTFNMPNVKVGSVIDVEYSRFLLPDNFNFQQHIPVKLAYLAVEESTFVRFQTNQSGFERIEKENNVYIARNVPSFKPEPFINSANNYITKLEFEIIDVSFPGFYYTFSTTWDAVCTNLRDDSNFGGALEGSMYLNSVVKEIEETCTTVDEKLKAAHKHAQKIRWNQYETNYTTEEAMSYTYKQEIGNSADVNIMLIQLLRKLGYEANPVVMSSRKNGVLHYYPTLSKLNYVICHAVIEGKNYLMDATDEYLPYTLLPDRALNYTGRLIRKKGNVEYKIKSPGSENEVVSSEAYITEDFSVKGKVVQEKVDYAAYKFRKKYKSFNSQEEFLEDYESKNPGLKIVEAEIENIEDVYAPIKLTYEFEYKNLMNVFDDEIFIEPMLFGQTTDNPFKIDQRKYPVDFVHPSVKTYVSKIKIPEGYVVAKLPQPANLKLPGNKGKILYSVNQAGEYVSLTCRIVISEPFFLETEYLYLKEFYNQVIKKEAEPVVFKKIDLSANKN